MSRKSLSTYRALSGGDGFSTLLDWGETHLGTVTGNNRYFSLSHSEAISLQLPDRDLIRISPPGARHLRGFKFTNEAWESLVKEGARCRLFYPREKLSNSAARYVADGEEAGVDQAYKCAVRSPW